VPEPDDDAVRILTVHGSKGLEFPVVVLAGLTNGATYAATRVLWGDRRPEVRITVPYRSPHAFASAGFDELSGGTRQADDDEARRLLYVAATRARDRLLVSLHHKPGGKPTNAQLLFARCDDLGVPRRARVADPDAPVALSLLEESAGTVAPPPVAPSARAARLAALDATLAAAARSWAVPPTGLAGDHEPDDDSGPADPAPHVGDEGERAEGVARRGGSAVGRAVHGVLETVDLAGTEPVPRAAVEQLAARFAEAEGVDDAATVADLAASALASSALAEARASGRLWREVPVVAPVGDRLVEGFVDLLHEAPDGSLVVVDWKTDSARTDAELRAAAGRYRLQGAGYALALGRATGRRVARVRFVFCRAGGVPAVELDIDDLDAAITEATGVLQRT